MVIEVTWQDAEDALTAAIEYLARMPDRERGFLSAGSRSCWPEIVRERWDYAQGEGALADDGSKLADDVVEPSPALTRRMMDHLERMLLGAGAAAQAIPEAHRALVGRVLVMKRWPGADGFGWDKVFVAEERACMRSGGGKLKVTSDALRRRYDRAVGKVAWRMERLGIGRV